MSRPQWLLSLIAFLLGIGIDVSPLQSWWLTGPLWAVAAGLFVWWVLPHVRSINITVSREAESGLSEATARMLDRAQLMQIRPIKEVLAEGKPFHLEILEVARSWLWNEGWWTRNPASIVHDRYFEARSNDGAEVGVEISVPVGSQRLRLQTNIEMGAEYRRAFSGLTKEELRQTKRRLKRPLLDVPGIVATGIDDIPGRPITTFHTEIDADDLTPVTLKDNLDRQVRSVTLFMDGIDEEFESLRRSSDAE
jgi:hypothetical protein